jgi:hypothetical protein
MSRGLLLRRRRELAPLDFAFDYLTRSGRVDMERLRGISSGFISRYEQHISRK